MPPRPKNKNKTKQSNESHSELYTCRKYISLLRFCLFGSFAKNIWLASSYVFSGHYLTGTMFIVIVTKPKIKKKKRKLRKSRFYVVISISIVIVIVIVMLIRSHRQCKWCQTRIWLKMSKNLVPNAKKVDNPIYWINLYPEDSAILRGPLPYLVLCGYVPLNRVWFSRSWVLNRVRNFTIKHLEQGVFLDWKPFKECEDLRWAVYICNTNNFFRKHLLSRF